MLTVELHVCARLQIDPSPLLAPMPFTSLHSIELQLILRFCDGRSLIAVARCCQTTLGAAANAFAWDAATPIRVSFLSDGFPHDSNQRLLRHAPIALFWPAGVDKSAANVDRFLAVAKCLPNLASIEVQARALLADALSALFDLPSCCRLRLLTINARWFKPAHLRQLAAHCPQLHTLHLSHLRSPPQRFVNLLPTLPSLRSLHLVHTRAWVQCTHGDTMAAGHLCLHLGVSPASTVARFTRVESFAARIAVLERFFMHPEPEWGVVLSALPALHTLYLHGHEPDLSDVIRLVLQYSASIRTIEFSPDPMVEGLLNRLWLVFDEATQRPMQRSALTAHAPPMRLLVRWPRPHTDDGDAGAGLSLSQWRSKFELVRPPSDEYPACVALVDGSE